MAKFCILRWKGTPLVRAATATTLVLLLNLPTVALAVVGAPPGGCSEDLEAPNPVRTNFLNLRAHVARSVLGQDELLDGLLYAILVNGNVLVESSPGAAKTRVIKTIAGGIQSEFSRIQFVSDMMPSDIIGAQIFDSKQNVFKFHPGPLFANFVLADEINRASPKTQSALLQAMEEGVVTSASKTHRLPDVYLILATQNPIENDGVYPLPEAQLDRFLFKIKIDYPEAAVEKEILRLNHQERINGGQARLEDTQRLSLDDVRVARRQVLEVTLPDNVENYIVRLVTSTRPKSTDFLKSLNGKIAEGASPRASIGLANAARARAWLNGNGVATTADVDAVAHSILRHRIKLTDMAVHEGATTDGIVDQVITSLNRK